MKQLAIILTSSLFLGACSTSQKVFDSTMNNVAVLWGGSKHTNATIYAEGNELDEVWDRSIGKQNQYLSATLDGENIYVVNVKGKVHGYDIDNGEEVVEFKVKADDRIQAGLGIGGDALYMVDDNGFLYSVNKNTGGLNWKSALNVEVVVPPVTYDNQVLIHSINGSLINVNALTGDIFWRYDHPQPSLTLRGGSKPLITDDAIITGFADGRLVANDKSAGFVLWDIDLSNPNAEDDIQAIADIDTQPFLDRNGILYVSSYQGKTAALDINNGQVVWEALVSTYRPYALTSGRMYLIDGNKIIALNRQTGQRVVDIVDDNIEEFTSLFQFNGNLYALDNDGYAYQVDPQESLLLSRTKIADDKGIATPMYFKSNLIILTKDGELTLY